MAFWLVAGGLLLAAVAGALLAPPRPWLRPVLPGAALAAALLLLAPMRGVSMPTLVCRDARCHLSGLTIWTPVGLRVPAADQLGYGGALLLAIGIGMVVAGTTWTVLRYRGRFGRGRQ